MRNDTGNPDFNSILVIRRDNIGDLVCTTPLLTALRERFSRAWIGVLANSYNAPVLDGNPDIDETYSYKKLKHRGADVSALGALGDRIRLIRTIRRKKLDLIVLAAGPNDVQGARFARLLAPLTTFGSQASAMGEHEVERTFTAARLLGIEGKIPPLRVVPNKNSLEKVHEVVKRAGLNVGRTIIGLHISARRIAQRWPARQFADLAIALHEKYGAATIIFWSPGDPNSPKHPGDDDKAAAVLEMVAGRAQSIPWPTSELSGLIAGLAACHAVICSDGGAMHIAAALGKPIVCFFGDSPVDRWRPWGVRHVVLQAKNRHVAEISVDEALASVSLLLHS